MLVKPFDYSRRVSLDLLCAEMGKCDKCRLSPSRCKNNMVVMPNGSTRANIMLVGEAPGKNEDECGDPFVGLCGQLLTKLLEEVGVERKNLFITNVVKCRPFDNNRNRQPDWEIEVDTCKTWLAKEIRELNPKVVVALGKVPTRLLTLQDDFKFQMRDFFKVNVVHYEAWKKDMKIVAAWHPSYLLRKGEKEREEFKECLKLAMKEIGNV